MRRPQAPSERYAPLPAELRAVDWRRGWGTQRGVRFGFRARSAMSRQSIRRASPARIVTIDAVIGTDGFVKEATVTNDAPDALARSAINAVRQWEFDPTLLNCEAVDVRMSVTVDFR
jgi:hypothetical protein